MLRPFLRKYIYFILAGSILAAGFMITAVSFIKDNPVNDRKYLPLNNEIRINLKPGKYSIFYEFDQSKKQFGPLEITKSNRISNLNELVTVHVKDKEDKGQIAINKDPSLSYTMNINRGESIYSFKIPKENEYIITVATQNSLEIEPVRITLMSDFSKELVSLFLVEARN